MSVSNGHTDSIIVSSRVYNGVSGGVCLLVYCSC